MSKCSVTIICFNEEAVIAECIKSALSITDDVIVVDSFSDDETANICKSFPVNFIQNEWSGYGNQKNYAASFAKNDWILSLDADETISTDLKNNLNIESLDKNYLYKIRRRNQYAGKWIRFGMYGRDTVLRMYNKTTARWNKDLVHETIVGIKQRLARKNIEGTINHSAYTNEEEHLNKATRYATLGAEKLYQSGRRANAVRPYIKAGFRFFKEYFLLLGIFDGTHGFSIARINSKETFLKYKLLYNKTKVK